MTARSVHPYDALTPAQQQRVRDGWDARIAARLRILNLAVQLRAAGRSYVELDAGGNVVRCHPDGSREVLGHVGGRA